MIEVLRFLRPAEQQGRVGIGSQEASSFLALSLVYLSNAGLSFCFPTQSPADSAEEAQIAT